MKASLNKMYSAKDKLDDAVKKVQADLKDKIEFLFAVVYLDSDGWMILHEDSANVAPLRHCIPIIEEKGFLTEEDFEPLCV